MQQRKIQGYFSMTNSKNSYSVSDLANLLQVPRTTVNDWLKKFDRYIDFEMRGRRKVYTDASLEVLQLISSARDRGTPLTDLEQELSQRCAVRPEISPLAQEENEKTPAAKPVSAPPQQEENLPAVNFDFSGFLKELEIREKRRSHSVTQMTFGYSRDDVASFLPIYLEKGILKNDPFAVLDQVGVGQLVNMATQNGRSVNPNLKCGICGEHGGEPSSVEFCHRVGLNYVSCSPFRVPIARLAAAQAAVEDNK